MPYRTFEQAEAEERRRKIRDAVIECLPVGALYEDILIGVSDALARLAVKAAGKKRAKKRKEGIVE